MVAALLTNPNFSSSLLSLKLRLWISLFGCFVVEFAQIRRVQRFCNTFELRLFPSLNELSKQLQNVYNGNVPTFPRVKVWDPYKRLGISPYESEEEIWSSHNFLAEQYAGDERSVESIEAAFEKLLMKSFWERKRTKINLKTRLKSKLPATVIILRRLFLLMFMTAWSIMNSAEGGPAFHFSLVTCALTSWVFSVISRVSVLKFDPPICCLNSSSLMEAVNLIYLYGISGPRLWLFGSLVAGWLSGSILGPMVLASILPTTWTLELLTSLFAFLSLFVGCTFLK
ncbi:hypothetical protein RND81_09G089300 [Saponaria officinalis]|uniref:Uncharacterized protein n=1 Tax=Saponaria officinalis TaxID=3572 RepID=A0AAW1IK71_SAPOF